MKIGNHAKRLIIPFHLFALFAVIISFSSPKCLWLTFLGWFLVGPIGAGIGYHRLLAHHDFSCCSWVETVLVFLGTLSGQAPPLHWVAIHRHHHKYADTLLDVHSPRHGFFMAYCGWQLRDGALGTIHMYSVRGLLRNNSVKFFQQHYYKVIWGFFSVLLLFDWRFALFGLALPSVIYFHEINLINTLGHISWAGYRNYNTPDQSVNNILLGYLTFGVGFHNNHHANLNQDQLRNKGFEIDISAHICKLLSRL